MGYGPPYWIIAIIITYPFYLLSNEAGVIISLRLCSLVCAIGSFILVLAILKTITIDNILPIIIITWCFFMPVNITYSTIIHPDTIYAFFLVLSLYLLVKDDNKISNLVNYSVVSFVIALSIKVQALIFSLVYIMYLLFNYQKLDRGSMFRLIGIGFSSLIILNLPLILIPSMLQSYMSFLSFMRTIVKEGWFRTDTPGISFAMFSINYVNIYSFLIIMTGSLVFLWRDFDKKRKNNTYLISLFLIIMTYFLFQTIYIRTSHIHYSLIVIYLLPILIVYFIDNIKKISGDIGLKYYLSCIVLIMLMTLNYNNICYSLQYLSNPAGSQHTIERYDAMNKLTVFINSYDDKLILVGVAHDLAVPYKNGIIIPFERFFSLSETEVLKYNLMIFWKLDSYYPYYTNRVKRWEDTHDIYLKIINGSEFSIGSKSFYYQKVKEDGDFEIYKKINIG